LRRVPDHPPGRAQRSLLIGRLQQLQSMGLAEEVDVSRWTLSPQTESVLRGLGERGDIIRTMQRALGRETREYALPGTQEASSLPAGRILAKGLHDELHERGYLVVDGIDGRVHYATLAAGEDLAQFPVGGIVEGGRSTGPRPADRTIAQLAIEGIYRPEHHLALARAQARRGYDPETFVAAHVRRLEALRRAGIVERLDAEHWRVPADLPQRGQQYDEQRLKATVELHSPLPIEQQTRVLGATWLDRQLLTAELDRVPSVGFGAQVRSAAQERLSFLVEQGFAERRGQQFVLGEDLLGRLRARELEAVARRIEADSGLTYQPAKLERPVTGTYRRALMLASGRFAMLEEGAGFTLVPWRPVIEKRLGQHMSAVLHRDEQVTWHLGRARGRSI